MVFSALIFFWVQKVITYNFGRYLLPRKRLWQKEKIKFKPTFFLLVDEKLTLKTASFLIHQNTIRGL